MSKKRLLFYIIVLAISFAALTTFLMKKYFMNPIQLTNTASVADGYRSKTSGKKTTIEKPSPEPTPDFWMPGGRDDPFALLPEEEALKTLQNEGMHTDSPVSTSAVDDSKTIPGPSVQEPVFPNDVYVRGIIIGNTPQAYIEENGTYRKVVAGDLIAGGEVLRITEQGVLIEWNNREIWLKPAE